MIFKIKALLNIFSLIFFTILLKPFFFLNKKKIWFFIDRPYGIDNAYFLYEYVKKRDENITCIYLYKNKSDARYKWILDDENIVYNFSLKHFRYFIHADNIIFSFDTKPFFFNQYFLIFKYLLKPLAKQIFLQHGVSKADIISYHKKNTHFDLLTSVSKREKEILQKYRWYDKEVVLTWFPRFDNLQDFKPENIIMFMPTWKKDLYGKSDTDFKRSDYYEWINNVLSSKNLHKILKQYNYKLLFVIHYMLEEYIHLFDIKDNNIEIVDIKNTDNENNIQNTMKKSKILITDYSSIMFDFAYMWKPSIYYRFDTHHFDEKFNVEKEWFWKIVYNKKDVLEELSHILDNNAIINKLYLDKVNSFFYKRDWNNCKRTYNEILKI